MRMLVLSAAFSLMAGAALAASHIPNDAATLCLGPLGESHPPVCHNMSASRLESKPDICLCNGPTQQVKAPWCGRGEKPPADSAAFERARAQAAKDGSLFGDSYQGRNMCVELRPNGG